MYNASRTLVLWFFPILMIRVYMWGYFWPTYIRHSNVSAPAGSGHYNFIGTFSNVRHVWNLKKNLISLGTLDANGYTYSSSGGKFKICKDLMVIMRGEMLLNNLYKLLGDSISGGAAISTPENSEMTQLIYGIFVLDIWVSGLWRSCIRGNY